MTNSSLFLGLRAGLSAFDELGSIVRNPVQTVVVDRLTLTGSLDRLAQIDAHTLLALRHSGHQLEVIAGRDGWSLTVRADSAAAPTLEADDEAERALDASVADELRKAMLRGDADAVLQLAGELPATVTFSVCNDAVANTAHWVASESVLVSLLTQPGWHTTTRTLDVAPHVLVVGDWGDRTLHTDGLRLIGPDAELTDNTPQANPERPTLPIGSPTCPTDRPKLPSPERFSTASGSGDLPAILRGVTRCLAWYWTASSAEIRADSEVHATLTGARTVEIILQPAFESDTMPDIELFRWSFATTDPGRIEAARQAISLAIVDQRDLSTAAGPALRTAKSLYELSRRGAIGEALAARRAARDASLAAARQGAAAARGASGRAIERTLAQTVALAAVVLTRAADVVGTKTAVALAGAVAILALGSWAVTVVVELPSAANGLSSELADLDQYRDTLAQDDIEAIRGMTAVAAARDDIRRAQKAVNWVYAAIGIAAIVSALALIGSGNSRLGESTPRPTSSKTGPTTATPPPQIHSMRPATPAAAPALSP